MVKSIKDNNIYIILAIKPKLILKALRLEIPSLCKFDPSTLPPTRTWKKNLGAGGMEGEKEEKEVKRRNQPDDDKDDQNKVPIQEGENEPSGEAPQVQ